MRRPAGFAAAKKTVVQRETCPSKNLQRMNRKHLRLVLILVLTLVVGIKIDRRLGQHSETESPSQASGAMKPDSDGARGTQAVGGSNESHIDARTRELQRLESKRASFCREHEDESNIYYDFIIASPSPSESREMMTHIVGASGVDQNWFDHQLESLSQQLQDDFFFTGSTSSSYHLSICYSKSTGRGDYSVVGIDDLAFKDDGTPHSLSGEYTTVWIGRPFFFDKPWRFSHLIQMDLHQEKPDP